MRETPFVKQSLRAVQKSGGRITPENLSIEVGLIERKHENVEKNVRLVLSNLVNGGDGALVAETICLLGTKTGMPSKSKTPAFADGLDLPFVSHEEAREQLFDVGRRYCEQVEITDPSQVRNLSRTIADQFGRPLATVLNEVSNAKSEWSDVERRVQRKQAEVIGTLTTLTTLLVGPNGSGNGSSTPLVGAAGSSFTMPLPTGKSTVPQT